jgi:RNA polymerase sigma factor (sigma-70 family)
MAAIDGNSFDSSGQYPCVATSGASDPSDATLIVASIGEPQAFGRVFDRHAPLVHRYLTSRVGADDADDLLSEVFLVAFRGRAGYEARFASSVPWLLGIATNVVRHHRRSEGRRWAVLRRLNQEPDGPVDPALDDGAKNLMGRVESEQIEIALSRIDERYRDVLILHAGFDLTYAEIATTLGLRLGTVRSRISRGRTKLRELLATSGQYISDDTAPRSFEVEETSQ